jgi:opacity protein-like surface antigen
MRPQRVVSLASGAQNHNAGRHKRPQSTILCKRGVVLFARRFNMLKAVITTGLLAGMLCATSIGRAQALPTATGRGGGIQAGGGYSVGSPDYGQRNIQGITAFADFDFLRHVGVEADVHYLSLITPQDLGENTYLVGPRFLLTRGRFTPYAKAQIGIATLVIQETQDNAGRVSGNFLAYSFGGGLDIRVTRHFVVRAIDAEYQLWPNFSDNGLNPAVITAGAAWRFR